MSTSICSGRGAQLSEFLGGVRATCLLGPLDWRYAVANWVPRLRHRVLVKRPRFRDGREIYEEKPAATTGVRLRMALASVGARTSVRVGYALSTHGYAPRPRTAADFAVPA